MCVYVGDCLEVGRVCVDRDANVVSDVDRDLIKLGDADVVVNEFAIDVDASC